MQITPRAQLLQFGHLLRATLFGAPEHSVGTLSSKARLLISVLALLPAQALLPPARGWRGRPAKSRHALAVAFLAKAVYGIETTRQLIDRLRSDR